MVKLSLLHFVNAGLIMENYSGKRLVIVLVIVAILLILSFIFFGRDDGGSVEAIHPIIGVILT